MTITTAGLVAAYMMNGTARDFSGNGHHATANHVACAENRFGKPRKALLFNGIDATLAIPDHRNFSVNTTGFLSIAVWVRPEGTALNEQHELLFANTQGSGYVHWFGKGDASGIHGNREWSFRIYSADNTETPNRHNRMSFYHFSYDGGLGPGCYTEDPLVNGEWIHYVAMVSKPDHRIWWYKNGQLRDTDGYGAADHYPIPDSDLRNGNAPIKMGSQDGGSFFKGAIDNIYIYNRLLTATEITALYHDPTP